MSKQVLLQVNVVATWSHEPSCEVSLMTFLVSVSSLKLFGIGSAFWGYSQLPTKCMLI